MAHDRSTDPKSVQDAWEEHNLSQLRYFRSLPLRTKLEAVQGMADVLRRFEEMRERGEFTTAARSAREAHTELPPGVREPSCFESGGGHTRRAQMTTSEKYLYGGRPAETQPAAGVKGVLIRTLDGLMIFRVYHDRERFTDYEIRHDDLAVTIDSDALAAFYKVEGRDVLDHSPEVLELKSRSGQNQS